MIPLVGRALAVLRERRLRYKEGRLRYPTFNPLRFVFADPSTGDVRDPDLFTEAWRNAAKRAKVSRTLHELRHTAASLTIGAGVDIVTVSKILGHADPSITLRVYGHMLAGNAEDALQVLNDRADAWLLTPALRMLDGC